MKLTDKIEPQHKYRGYYMATQRYQISLLVLKKKYFTSERSKRVKYFFFNTRREIWYLQVTM